MRVLPIALTAAIACIACTGREAPSATTPTPATAPSAATVPAPPSTTTLPATGATVSSAATVAPPPSGAMPAAGAITFNGFGPAHWGASEEQVRQAWGKDLQGAPNEPNGCYYLFPEPRSAGGYRLAFMFEGAKFARLDVRVAEIVAPRGGRVGMDKTEVLRLYPAITEQKHKYVEGGLNLRGMDPEGGAGVIVFEVDPSGKVTAWRVGMPPQVDYVEGCS